MIKIRIESLYGVALAKLLMDKSDNLRIVNPNLEQQELLHLESKIEVHDVQISDLENRAGIMLQGTPDQVAEIENILFKSIPDAIFHKHKIQKDSIFIAKIERIIERKNMMIVDLGNASSGIVFGKYLDKDHEEGDSVIVQVKELPIESDKLPVCSEQINLSGNYVILEKSKDSKFVRVSKKIMGQQRQALHELGKKIRPEGFGIIMRTSAADAAEDKIVSEIRALTVDWEGIVEAKQTLKQKEVWFGETVTKVNLSYNSKKYLDEILAKIIAIVPDYHNIKSYSMATGYTVDFANHFVTPENTQAMNERLYYDILSTDYAINHMIKTEFLALDGTIAENIIGEVQDVNDGIIRTKFVFNDRNWEKDDSNYILYSGDYVYISFKQGSWTIYYKYFTADNELIGERIQIITPLDYVFRGRIRTVDLGINIYLAAENNEIDVVDNNADVHLVAEKIISPQTDEKIGTIIEEAINKLTDEPGKPVIVLK